jgi:hypothetical protein
VGERELGKSIAVQIHNEFKRAYHYLASLLLKEGIISDPSLIFFLTHFELHQFVHHRRVRYFVNVAKRRQRAMEFQKQFSFSCLSLGQPIPNVFCSYLTTNQLKTDENFHLNGMPVRNRAIFSLFS